MRYPTMRSGCTISRWLYPTLMIAACVWWATVLKATGTRSRMPCCPGSHAQPLPLKGLDDWWTSTRHGSSTSGRGAYGHLYLGGSAGPTPASEGDYATLLRDRRGTPGATGVHRGVT